MRSVPSMRWTRQNQKQLIASEVLWEGAVTDEKILCREPGGEGQEAEVKQIPWADSVGGVLAVGG